MTQYEQERPKKSKNYKQSTEILVKISLIPLTRLLDQYSMYSKNNNTSITNNNIISDNNIVLFSFNSGYWYR